MNIQLQPTLQNEYVILEPLKESDFEALYKVASDPLVWEQHPNKNRYQREVFRTYFEGAIQSKGAFLVRELQTKEVIGCTRFYDYNAKDNSILIGYTFLGRNYWGGKFNPSMKKLMLEHAFTFVDKVLFHIGANNIRSQTAIQRIGASKIGEELVAYHGESSNINFIYCMEKKSEKSPSSSNL